MLNILVLESNQKDLQQYCNVIQKTLPKSRILKANNEIRAFNIIQKFEIDVFFLSVRDSNQGGLYVARQMTNKLMAQQINIAFILGNVADKQSIKEDFPFCQIIDRPAENANFETAIGFYLESLCKAKYKRAELKTRDGKKILLENKDEMTTVGLEDIYYVESQNRSLLIHLKDRAGIITKDKLEFFIKSVGEPSFVRCHKSFAVNLLNAASLESTNNRLWTVTFSKIFGADTGNQCREDECSNFQCSGHTWCGSPCYVSRTYLNEVKNLFSNISEMRKSQAMDSKVCIS